MKLRLEVYILTILVFLFSINIASAITVDEIMDKMEETAPDFTTQKTISEMILIDQEGNEEIREMIMFSQEGENGKSSTLVRFLSPKSVKGVTLLNIDDGEKIYLYMPAYDKPRRIASSSKGDEFMGTGLSYEDMSMDYKDKDYEKKLLEETESVYIIEVIPSGEDISYKKIILIVDKEKFYTKKVEFYNMSGNLTKTLEIDKIRIDDKGKITPMEIAFTDIEEKHKTKIVIKEIEYDVELSSSFFSIRTLSKPTL
ncbi:outer membrane lipoprotein-sorting protein [bacterium]|nr:outer membrane lipoprotein-sorting protein [bacterium]MBU1428313.1 outer membrane lipoprotein-sorting protein [bacterium]MBU2439718.1 outer membrane lipoprotein-sorting protein [bacterium]